MSLVGSPAIFSLRAQRHGRGDELSFRDDAYGSGPHAADLQLVSRWIEARNDFDLEGMIACTSEDVEFHPLRLLGSVDIYAGHEGMREWLAEVQERGLRHQLHVDEVRENGVDEVLAIGKVELPGRSAVAEFYGIFKVSNGLIDSVHHYISTRRTMETLGLLRPT